MTNGQLFATGALCHEDLPLFRLLELMAWKMAVEHRLGLVSFEPKRRPHRGYWGFCQPKYGRVAMVLRWKHSRTGQWAPEPLPTTELIDVLAHELAHLRVFPGERNHHGRKWCGLADKILKSLKDDDHELIEEINFRRRTR